MRVSALASGSSGNCFYIENNKKSGILIDAGISSKQIIEKLDSIGRKPQNVNGIFITHEHTDHIKGADVFARKFNIPIFATEKTAESSLLCSNNKLVKLIGNKDTIKFKGLEISAFSKSHNAADPVGYSVYNEKIASVITDLGFPSKSVTDAISMSDFLFIESNHDVEMLDNGPYPYYLKKLIRGNEGHLSNTQAGLCVMEYGRKKLNHVLLSHLSKINNTPKLALDTFNSLIKERRDLKPKIMVSERVIPSRLVSV